MKKVALLLAAAMLALAGCSSAGDTAAASEAAPAESTAESAAAEDSFVVSRRAVTNSLKSKVKSHHSPSELAIPAGTPISELEKRLALIKP